MLSANSVVAAPRLFVFPGMGATSEMHRGVARYVGNVTFCDWPSHIGCRTFSDLAERCIEEYSIRPGDMLAGSSMGGMVAGEIATKIGSSHLMLIGSCLHPAHIPMRKLAYLSSPLLNDHAMRLIGAKGHISLLAKMAKQVGAPFIRWGLQALHEWPGVKVANLRSFHSIHGLLDPVIPIFGIKGAEWVATGGHFIAMSHPHRVGRFLSSTCRTLAGTANT